MDVKFLKRSTRKTPSAFRRAELAPVDSSQELESEEAEPDAEAMEAAD